jgi:putative DNA methylase
MAKYHKKLIEVALPLEAINTASAREKQPGIGAHPRGLHLWWARRPLAAARAVIFAQMVDDPSEYVEELLADSKTRQAAEKTHRKRLKAWEERKVVFDKADAAGMSAATNPGPGRLPTLEDTAAVLERERLFGILEELVLWKNTTNEKVLEKARAEILRSWRRTCAENIDHPRAVELFDPEILPAFHDPFAGGGALPLEAQRLGLESYASDLNPVAVLINKAMIEIPQKFTGRSPVNPAERKEQRLIAKKWRGAQGLAEDVRYYGQWMRDEAEKRIGHLYPKVEITPQMTQERPDLKQYIGQKLTVIAWIWARTVKSPNPAFAQVDVPLATTFMLSTKAGKEAYVEPVIEGGGYRFIVNVGKPKDAESAKRGTKAGGSRSIFLCMMSGTPMPFEYLRSEAKAGQMGSRLMAIVAKGTRGRIYLSPTSEMEKIALSAQPQDTPETDLPEKALGFRVQEYGMTKWCDLYTPRQLLALTTFSDLVHETIEKVKFDALAAGLLEEGKALADGGTGARAYADAVGVYLAFAISRLADYNSSVATWKPSGEQVMQTYKRQAIAMTWDYPESNVLGQSAICWKNSVKYSADNLLATASQFVNMKGAVIQQDASTQLISLGKVVSTDPPYYDNIGYADLSDFFYIWLRRSLKPVFPELFATLAVPKDEELVATPYRHGSKEIAEMFFLDGMTQAMKRLAEQVHPAFPVTIYYAFKQSEIDIKEGTTNTGWDTFLAAVIEAGFAISGTWPMRTEMSNRIIGSGTNALASSIVLVCRKRDTAALIATRRGFVSALKAELPIALVHLQAGNIAPVDLAQAAIGPGMAVYTRYAKVLDAQGQPLSVRQALILINETLDEALAEQEGDVDGDTRWALAWFEQSGFAEGEFGTAELLSKAKDTSVDGMVRAGILASGRGKVRLLKPAELPADWDPTRDPRLTTWEMVHHLIRALEFGGENAAAQLMAKLGAKAEAARELCYRLYTLCERKKRTTEALSYNSLVQSWPEISRLARESRTPTETQATLF